MKQHAAVVVGTVTLLACVALTTADVWARASSGGSRGSRSFSAPARPAPAPTTPAGPSRTVASPASPQPASRPFGGWGSMLGGLLLGGLIGGLLFGRAGLGVGLLDLLVVAGAAMLILAMLRRRQPAPQFALAGAEGDGGGWSAAEPAAAIAAPASDVERGLEHIRSMDPTFDAGALTATARRVFSEVQRAVSVRDIGAVRDRLAPEMSQVLQAQCDRLRAARQTNRIEQIDLGRLEVSEAWQESGRDFVTVCITGSLLDYTVDDATGAVVDGSRTSPQEFEEYWTFTRPVGANPWKLSAIQTG